MDLKEFTNELYELKKNKAKHYTGLSIYRYSVNAENNDTGSAIGPFIFFIEASVKTFIDPLGISISLIIILLSSFLINYIIYKQNKFI